MTPSNYSLPLVCNQIPTFNSGLCDYACWFKCHYPEFTSESGPSYALQVVGVGDLEYIIDDVYFIVSALIDNVYLSGDSTKLSS